MGILSVRYNLILSAPIIAWIFNKIFIYILIVFANGPGDPGSIPGRVIPKTQKMLHDAAFLNTQYYKIWIKGKVKQSMEKSSALCRCSSYWKGSLQVALD